MVSRLSDYSRIRRIRVVRIFPNTESCPRPVRALAVETHCHLNMDYPSVLKKEAIRDAARPQAQ